MPENVLYYGDNLDILRRYIKDESVDLIYLDPPFKSNQDYNVLFAEKNGSGSASQIKAFEDTWHWDEAANRAYHEVVEAGGRVADALKAFRTFLGDNDMLAYLSMMAPRLVELRRVLGPTGSIYLHCDSTASHYLKMLMDAVFGGMNFQNEVTWKRTTAHNDPNRYGRISDRLLFYSKGQQKIFNKIRGQYSDEQMSRYKYQDEKGLFRAENLTAPHFSKTRTIEWRGTHPGDNRQWRFSLDELERLYKDGRILLQKNGKPRKDGLKAYLDEAEGPILQDIWVDISMPPTTSERQGYPTQKPEALLERIIQASSNEGDTVLDPFCGCGTAVHVAQRLKRKWIGIDITHIAITLIKNRMMDAFGEDVKKEYEVIGEPVSLPDAETLARDDPYQFQWWVLGLVGARPVEQKKGADKGIDGRLYFHDGQELKSKTRQIIFSVKAGHTGANHVRDLRGVIEREKAEIGVLLTLQEPTRPMREEAAGADFYESPWGKHPRLQIRTVAELLEGKGIDCPPLRQTNVTFKRAPKAGGPGQGQGSLDL